MMLGGNGGKGGNGGSGGNAGLSGNIDIYVKEADIDLLVAIESTNVDEARGGRGGAFGVGGTGGGGGRGGKTATKTITTRNGDGTTNYSYITIPGGSPGTNGRSGNDGSTGLDGLNGRGGKVTYYIVPEKGGNVEEFAKMFDLRLFSYADFVSNTGIIEPGQQLVVRKITLSNAANMTTPKNRIDITLQPSNMIETNDKDNIVMLSEIIKQNETLTLSENIQFYFKIAKITIPEVGIVFQTDATIRLTATVCRLKKILPSFDPIPKTIKIRYPLELSTCCGALCLSEGKRVPFTIKVRNVSLVALGSSSLNPRRIRIEISVPFGDYSLLNPYYHIEQDNKAKDVVFSLENPVVCDIQYLGAGEEYTLCGTLSIQNLPSERAYERFPLEVTLLLGDIDNPMALSTMVTIQKELFSLQLAEPLRLPMLPNDLLLVCNHKTTKEEVAHWDSIANDLQLSLNIWNISLYYGFSYFYSPVSVIESMKNGLVVFLNIPCHRDDDIKYFTETFYPLDNLAQCEIFEAARRYGIRTYIINQNKSAQHAFPVMFPYINTPYVSLTRKSTIQRMIDNPNIEIGRAVKPGGKNTNIRIPKATDSNATTPSAPPSILIKKEDGDASTTVTDGKSPASSDITSPSADIPIPSSTETRERSNSNDSIASGTSYVSVRPAVSECGSAPDDTVAFSPEKQPSVEPIPLASGMMSPTASAPPLPDSVGKSLPPKEPQHQPGPISPSFLSSPKEEKDDDDECEKIMQLIGKNEIDIKTINELEFISRSFFYVYLTWLKNGGREEHLTPYHQWISIRQTRLFTVPDQNALDKRLRTFVSRLQDTCPLRQYFFFSHFKPSKIENSGTFFSRYIVGDIELRRGLDISYGMIACKNRLENAPLLIDSDRVTLIKLLPFSRKLELFSDLIPSEEFSLHSILGNMILSDICEEQATLINYYDRTRRKQMEDYISVWSPTLKQFSKWDFHSLCSSDNLKGKEAMKCLLFKLRIFYERYRKGFLGRTSRMAIYIHQICEEMRQTYVPSYSMEQLQKQGNEWYTSIGKLPFDKLITFMRDPYRLTTQSITFNHWNLPKEVILTEKTGKALFSPKGEEQLKPDRYSDGFSGNENGFFSNHCSFKSSLPNYYPNAEGKILKEGKNGKDNQVWYHGTHAFVEHEK
jgi:hypothetical protein